MTTLPPMTATLPALGVAPIDTSAVTTYTDINGLAALKKDPNSPQAISAVAQQVDALFMQMMLKSMRDASAAMGEGDSNEMGMYQDMFDKQIALTLSQHQGLGLGSVLVRQFSAKGSPAVPAPTDSKSAGAPAAPRTVPISGASPAGTAPTTSTLPTTMQSAAEFVEQVLPTI